MNRTVNKKTVDIDMLVTSRNGDRKIIQSIRVMSIPPSRIQKSAAFQYILKRQVQ